MKPTKFNPKAEAPENKSMSHVWDEFQGFRVSFTPSNSGRFDIFLFEAIEEVNQFRDAIEALEAAGEDDLVVIHLSTPGGNIDATDTFIHAMRECKGRVVVKATGGVHSAGTVILLNAMEFVLSEHFNALIHNGFCGPAGKFSDWKAEAMHTEAHMERLARSTYEGFLTEDEIQEMLDGKDFWLDRDEWIRRWHNKMDYMQKLSQEGLDEEPAY